MHFKRRKRRRGGFKGCCGMCASQYRRGGLRNKRILTIDEEHAALLQIEGLDEDPEPVTGIVCRYFRACPNPELCQDDCECGDMVESILLDAEEAGVHLTRMTSRH